ncbi:hypothetical protein Bhyg_06979 [Pseudolycoriella hygida]|uniref:Uncharacterized protein n=1 Tax=Pseudolycoriella hygida TaxID=35572 RepID=A0A9Q0N1P8_9DIPT|nr:hypothetical protein Bhyg_06979 [Pseudolycoriella hygida]
MIRTQPLPQLILFVLLCVVKRSVGHNPISDYSSCPVYLTISSNSKNVKDSPILINWGPACENPPKWIGLYDKDPSISNDNPRAYIETQRKPDGIFETNVTIGQIKLPDGWNRGDVLKEPPKQNGGKCLPFYVAAFDAKTLRSIDCLKIQPNWMKSNKHLMDVPLKNMFIPGTHCSGCFYKKSKAQNVLVEKFGFTQNFDVWTQLVLGIRYLDISLGFNAKHDDRRNQANKFWVVNDNLFITPISYILEDVKKFVLLSQELVIIEFHQFPIDFNRERHIQFLKYLENKLGDIAFINDHSSNSYDLTINQMKTNGRLLLITYNEPEMEKETDIIWPCWKRFSTKDLKQTEIREYMRKVFSRKYEGSPDEQIGWSFFGRQSVESSYMDGYSLLTSRERANYINHNISIWLGGTWSLSANVVALDYFYNTNLVDMAIHTNHHKSSQTTDLVSFDMVDDG